MGSAETGFPLALLIIPLILFLTVGVLYALARYYQKKAHEEQDRLRADWRRFDSGYQDVVNVAREYLEDAQEPFLSMARKLREALETLDRTASPLRSRRVALKQRTNDLNANPWRAIIGAPYLWYLLYRDLHNLGKEMDSAWSALDATGQIEHELAEIGWKLAQDARQVRHLQRHTQELLENLRSRGMKGEAFEAAARQEQQARTDLRRIPDYFYDGDAEAVLAQADRESIIKVYQTLEKDRPVLEKLQDQAQEWERQAQAAGDQVAVLRKLLDDIDQTLNTLPKPVDTGQARKQLAAMEQVASTLQATLSRMEVENTTMVAQEAQSLAQSGQELSSQLKRARRELASLEGVLEEITPAFKDLSSRLAALGSQSERPVQLTHSLEELADLNRQANRLGGPSRKRSVEQVGQDLATAAGLRAKQKELAAHVAGLEQAHAALVETLKRPPLDHLQEWGTQARRTASEVASFSSENWARSDAVGNLSSELDALASAAKALAVMNPAEAVPEDELAGRVEQARLLADGAQRLQKRLENIQARLDDLKQAEGTARQSLEDAARQLGQIGFVVNSNQLLAGTAGQELDRLGGEIDSVLADLKQRQNGLLDRKVRAAGQLVAKIEQAANGWLVQLNQDAQEINQEISGILQALDEIAPLEEGAVDKARELLGAAPANLVGGPRQAGGRSARPQTQYPLDQLLERLRQASQYWESCSAALRALGDFQPLLESYEEANYYRGQARQAVSEASGWLRRKRAWPPTTVSLDNERAELEKIEAQWNDLRQNPTRAIQRVAMLGSLATRYQALAERISQAVERGGREEAEVDAIEGQIDEQASIWQELYQQYRDNPNTAAEIEELLAGISRDHEAIRRKYIQGSLDYNGAVAELKKLQKRLVYFKATLDDESSLDVRGNVTQRRESRRV